MTPSTLPQTPAAAPIAPPAELAAVMQAFNEVTARLTATHETLTAQVERLQGELREAKAAVERSRHLAMVGELAAGIAHEIRNPLGSIGLYARMLQEDLAAMPGPCATAGKIAGAVARLNAVVHDVLAFARPIKVRADEIDAVELMSGALEAARGPGEEWEGVEVDLGESAKKALAINGDPNLLHQALVNVIRNAAQAMTPDEGPRPENRRIELACQRRRVRDGEGRPQMMVSLSVRDTGPGFPAEVLPRVFQPFFTTRAAGTGLGLAIVHRILDAHGGRVAISNHPGGGAVVELLLPR
jgi:signal transduction histidine kinase